ncbi:MAG: glycosyltransferase family 2 protein [Candidatus Aenigmarchaeota archaeon]|nr:glycosyltransferase family 2 protein [Candidatus Aenigmarchaeota archaeon]
MKGISIIIPAHNEAAMIRKTVTDFLRGFPKSEIIVVDDGSVDGTGETVELIASNRVKLIRLAKRSGKGAAVMRGVAAAKKDLVAFVDADSAFGPGSLKRLLSNLDGYDCVIASKWKGKKFGEVEGSAAKKLFGRFWNLMSKVLLGLDFDDTQAGLKLFRLKALRGIGTKLLGKGFEFDAEILYRLKTEDFRIKEVFIKPKNYRRSTFSCLNIPSMLLKIVIVAVVLKLFSKSGKR